MGERRPAWQHTAPVQATHHCGFRCGSWRGRGCCACSRVLCLSSSRSPVRHKDLFSQTMALASAAPWVCLCRGDLRWQCRAASTALFPVLPGSFRGCQGTRLTSAAPSRPGRSCQAQEAAERFTRLLTPHSPRPSWPRGCAGAGPDPTARRCIPHSPSPSRLSGLPWPCRGKHTSCRQGQLPAAGGTIAGFLRARA